MKRGENRERAKQCHRSQCIIASQCTRISQSNCLLYHTYIIISYSPGQESQNVFQAAFPIDAETVKTKVGDNVKTVMSVP